MLKELNGVVDGVSLSSLVPGFVYDVPETTGAYLIELNAARHVRKTDLPTVVDIEGQDVDIAWLTGGVHVVQQETAHDRPRRRRRKRRTLAP